MKIYNTLSRKKEEFIPLSKNTVNMYVCGPTVYNYIHIGNARPLVFFDTVRRYFEYKSYKVNFVMNLTDIDDKIINRAIEENVDFREITKKYGEIYLENAKALNVELDKMIIPRATDYVEDMIEFISELEKKGIAYDTKDTVYFNVHKAKNYGKLSHKNIDELESGSRVEIDEEKKNPIDFALWKKQKIENEPAWESPWGLGRPGWHIECSTMAKKELGETIDIHGGGEDLQFPHHENEIAQSETLHNKPFANYWMHNSMITIDKEKMSKSLGNFFTINDIEKEYNLLIVRLWLISSHYRSPLDFSRESLDAIKNGYNRLKNTYNNLTSLLENANANSDFNEEIKNNIDNLVKDFEKYMDDDFNTANALSTIFEFSKFINSNFDENSNLKDCQYAMDKFSILLNILGIKFEEEIIDSEIEKLIEERNEARKNKDYQKADEIRDLLKNKGIELQDTSTGVKWIRK